MANAVLVERLAAAITANAVLVHNVTATAVPSTANAVLVYDIGASAVPPTGNAVFVQKLGASAVPAVPANAGKDQSVEPWSTVTLDGSATTGTIASYAWAQTNGTAVTLAGSGASRTFTAPALMAGDTLTFALTTTDNQGATSTDSVQVIVLSATEFIRKNGVWVPCRPRVRSGGVWV